MRRTKGTTTNVQSLAREFATRISQLMHDRMTAEVEARLASILDGVGSIKSGVFDRPVKISRGHVGAIVVHCPVPGCRNPGVRPKRNFCLQHSAQLGAAEKSKFRGAQLAARGQTKRRRKATRG